MKRCLLIGALAIACCGDEPPGECVGVCIRDAHPSIDAQVVACALNHAEASWGTQLGNHSVSLFVAVADGIAIHGTAFQYAVFLTVGENAPSSMIAPLLAHELCHVLSWLETGKLDDGHTYSQWELCDGSRFNCE